MITTSTLDVTLIEPRLKHPVIFNYFDALQPGESFIIHNDHDPKPLYYQLLGERGNIFTWEYLEHGPESWQVKIEKVPDDKETETVGALAAADYRKAEVFRKMGIDFCCGGSKTLKQASEQAGISEAVLKHALQEADKTPASHLQDFSQWDAGFLADYIINTHHRYVKDNAAIISALAQKVAQHHGNAHPELIELAARTGLFLNDLLSHLAKEEETVFPAIKQLAGRGKGLSATPDACTVSIAAAIDNMEEEHEAAGDDLRFFRDLSSNYSLPPDACNSYAYLFEKMKEFESDLFLHIHLENNILFPRAIRLEEEPGQQLR